MGRREPILGWSWGEGAALQGWGWRRVQGSTGLRAEPVLFVLGHW